MIVSIDHSPSEQVGNDPLIYHTSVIIASLPGDGTIDHGKMAMNISKKLEQASPNKVRLRKWSGSSRAYKENFRLFLFEEISKFDGFIFANTSNESTIRYSKEHYIKELKLENCLTLIVRGDKPFYRCNLKTKADEKDYILEICESRFLYFLHLAHLILRSYLSISNISINHGDWFVYADKLAGNGEMETLLQATFSTLLAKMNGYIRWANFKDSDEAEEDLLADNIAGLFNGLIRDNKTELINKLPSINNKNINWEIWDITSQLS